METTHKRTVETNKGAHLQSQREQQPADQGGSHLRSAAQQAVYRKAQGGSRGVGAADLLALQRTVGNRTIGSQILHTDRRSAHVARASYKLGDANINIDYGNVVTHDSLTEQQQFIEQSFQTWTGKPAKDISDSVKALSGPQRRWLQYAIDLLMDNPLPALDKVAAVQQLIAYAPGALQTPLAGYTYSKPSFAYENEVLRASGWMESALAAKLKEPGKDEQRDLDKLYNRTAAASGTAASSTCPAVRPASARLDEARLRTDLEQLLRTYITGLSKTIGSQKIVAHSLPDAKVIADAVQAEALTFFAPYIGRSQTRSFQQSWSYSANLTSTTAPNAIPEKAKEAFLANRARSRGSATGLLDAVHYDPRCDADETVFKSIIQKLLAEKDIQANLDTILSRQSFTQSNDEGAKVTVNLQHSADDDACAARWSLIETLCHELMHVYISQKFHKHEQ